MPRSALHHVDVFDRDRSAISIVDDDDRKPDCRLGCRNRQNEEREYLPDEVVVEMRKRDEVDIDGQQNQLDRHQNDDDVLAIDENTEDAEREEARGHRQIVPESDGHSAASVRFDRLAATGLTEPPLGTLITSSVVFGGGATCSATACRLTFSRCLRVSTIAPIIATSRIIPAPWKKEMYFVSRIRPRASVLVTGDPGAGIGEAAFDIGATVSPRYVNNRTSSASTMPPTSAPT